tara:strand:- start:307 stop:684 length:378 start_codon:yes stop_codon:yes gene_type:complete
MKNILGTDLKCCGTKPLTGYFRDGFCRTTETDRGRHVIACIVNEKFLHFTRQMGNDLSSSNPMYSFPGLKPGDKWCVCALRWKEAFDAGCAPKVILEATHEKSLEYVALDDLISMSSDPKYKERS